MQNVQARAQLKNIGLTVGSVHRNLPAAELTARSLARQEGILAANGALVVQTGARTGRSPADRFIVDEPAADDVAWSDVNQQCTPELFDRMLRKASTYLHSREVFVFDGYAGADKAYRLPIRVVADTAWHALFAQTLFLQPIPIEQEGFVPGFTIVDCGALHADPDVDGTRSAVFIGISFSRRMVLIFGTMYAGEMKKAVFTIMNYLLPPRGVLPLHCSANVGRKGDVALYFGLSGTGKTTLSADPHRRLVGDDEHGWSEYGIFNFEGGCYAKVIRLSPKAEPQIYQAIRFGSVLENVVVDPLTRSVLLGRRLGDREHARHVPGAAYPGRGDGWHRRPAAQHLLPHVRRHGRHAAHLEAHRRDGELPLPLGVHVEGGGHRDRREGAAADLLDVLRSPLHAAGPCRVRVDAARTARLGGRALLARQHRLERRSLRRRRAHEHRLHPPPAPGRAGRCARRRATACLTRSSRSWCPPAVEASRQEARPARRPGATPAAYDAAAVNAGPGVPGQLRAVRRPRTARGRGSRTRRLASRREEGS